LIVASERSIYSIGALAKMLGVSPATLRSWEDRYALVVPERSAGSQRLYSREDLDQLLFVCEQMQQGLSAADAHRVLAEHLTGNSPLDASRREASAERRILLVERDPYAAELAEYFLRTEGYAVDVVRRVADAEQVVRAQTVDLAVVDLMIGGGAGLTLCEHLAPDVPVLAVSVLDQHDRALEAGALAFVHKPFDSLTLVSAARDLIGTSAIVRIANRVGLA
jgi:DNA-binding transcriptional MerR regulator